MSLNPISLFESQQSNWSGACLIAVCTVVMLLRHVELLTGTILHDMRWLHRYNDDFFCS